MADPWTHLADISRCADALEHAPKHIRAHRKIQLMRAVEKLICHHGLLPSKQLVLAMQDTYDNNYQHPVTS